MNIQTLPTDADIQSALGLDGRGRRRRWVKRTLWLMVLAAIAAFAIWLFMQWAGETARTAYDTEPATRSDLVVKVQATGKIVPTTQVDVSSEMSGVIRVVNVDNNSLVNKGDVLAELDSIRNQNQLTRAQAALAASNARLATAKATATEMQIAYDRAEALNKKKVAAAQDLDVANAALARARAGVAAAEADIDVAKAEIAMQETDIAKTRILSPVDGIVLKRAAEPGQTVASSLQAPVLFTLAEDLTRMQVEAEVDEADIGVVRTGQQASFTVDAYPGRSFPAVIETIEFSPNVSDNVVTYTAVLSVDNSELLLRPGMTATALIVTETLPNALTVPNAALRYQPPKAAANQGFSITSLFMPRMPRFEKSKNTVKTNGERDIWVLVKGEPKTVTVKTGPSDGARTAIVSGDLAEGADVITAQRQAAK